MTTGAAKGTMAKIVANDTTSVTVSPAFSLAIAATDKCIIDLFGQKVLMVTGPAIGQRRVLTGGLQGNLANVTAIMGGGGLDEATITGLVGMTAADVGASILFRGMTNGGANNGLFTIATFISATSVTVINAAAIVESPGTGNWMVVGGVSIGVNAPFSPAPTAGGEDQFRIERSGTEIRGAIVYSFTTGVEQKAICWIGNTASMRGAFIQANSRDVDQGVEYDLRGSGFAVQQNATANAANAGFSGNIGNKNPLNTALAFQACRFQHGGTIDVRESTIAQFFVCSNITITLDRQSHSIGLTSFFGRQVSIVVTAGSVFNISGNATTRSRIDVSRNTAATVGMIDISCSPFNGGGPVTGDGPVTNLDLLNGSGHGIALNDGAFGNIASVGGNGHAGYGISGIRNSPFQVRTSTTVTGVLGNMSLDTDKVGFNTVVTYASLAALPAGINGVNSIDAGGNFTGCRVEKVTP
jgi:hypothetical protein